MFIIYLSTPAIVLYLQTSKAEKKSLEGRFFYKACKMSFIMTHLQILS
jgi:hypothetical protein